MKFLLMYRSDRKSMLIVSRLGKRIFLGWTRVFCASKATRMTHHKKGNRKSDGNTIEHTLEPRRLGVAGSVRTNATNGDVCNVLHWIMNIFVVAEKTWLDFIYSVRTIPRRPERPPDRTSKKSWWTTAHEKHSQKEKKAKMGHHQHHNGAFVRCKYVCQKRCESEAQKNEKWRETSRKMEVILLFHFPLLLFASKALRVHNVGP